MQNKQKHKRKNLKGTIKQKTMKSSTDSKII